MELCTDSLGIYMEKICSKYSENEAIVSAEDQRRFSYKKLSYQVNMIAKCLIALGIKKGDHIAIVSCNSPEWLIVFLATVKIGAVLICLNYTSTEKELEYTLRHSDSTILIVSDKDLVEKINIEKFDFLKITLKMKTLFNIGFVISQMKEISDNLLAKVISNVSCDDLATIIYTSGTTGSPKGVMLTHKAIINGVLSHKVFYKYTPKDRVLVSVPLHHIMGGYYTALMALFSGSTILLMKRFQTIPALKFMEQEKCTGFHGVPTMYQFLLNEYESYDLSTLRVGMVAGSISSENLLFEVMDKLHVKELNLAYGQTETLGVTQIVIKDKSNPKISTVGKTAEGIKIKICNISNGNTLPENTCGEILVQTPYRMSGYYKDTENTDKVLVNDWIHTGDIGYLDADGYLYVNGRLKDIIIRGGENISPKEIEDTLTKHNLIESAVVVGVPDKNMGEEIFAFVQKKQSSDLSKEDILNYLMDNIAQYKCPKYIKFIDDFPMTSNGKIKRTVLKEIAIDSF